ncbi:mucin-22-like isoform X2 [Diprion similis]|uniref:mucin-22-like isoform X2 n=1 Tax=Diprion similis TaxID=362088 RepID=UPI001EF852E2|nr:mucin-22-like isoform X2 [Diprion similis]
MSILHRISVIAICASFIFGADGQATCALSYENGTELSDTYWSFGFVLDAIDDTSESGTVLLNMTASSITSINTIVADSDSGYFYMQPVLENGQFIVTLTDYFSQYEELESTSTMLVTITFTCSVNSRSLEIYQPITDTNNNYPEFQDAPYTYELPMPFPSGFSVQLFGTISAKDIDLTNTNISFTLNSSDSNANGFSASWLSQDTSDTKLHYAQLLTTALLNIEEDVTFKIYATDTGTPALTSETSITISVDEENSTPSSPIFTYPVYIADLSGLTEEEANGTTVVFNQGDITLSQGASNTTSFTIVDNIGSYEDNFLITVSEDYTTISITLQNVGSELLAEYYVILTLTAVRTGATDTGITILHIALPGIVSTGCSSTTTEGGTTIVTSTIATISAVTSETESTIATTTITECPTITTDDCVCDSSTTVTSGYESTYTTTTTDRSEDSTTTSTSDGATDTTENVATTTTTVETTECPVVTVTQECDCTESTVTTSYSAATTTVAVDTLTTTLSPGSETTTLSTEDDTTITTTTIVTPGLSFSSSTYRFDKNSTFTGILMTQTAVATNAEGTIVYSVSIDDDDLSSRVIIDADTATLEVTAAISPGVYTFQILATIDGLSISASATVILVISTLTECSGDIVFGYALQIIELEEESAHENILPLDDNGCNYTIYSQTPSQDLFTITGNYLNTVAIDREASYFSNMTVAQVRVIIDASCPNDTDTTNNTTTTRSKRDTEYEILTENIAYERTRTVLIVIITDINDNAPVWNSNTPTYIGFPGYELAQLILVPYVYQLGATDADIDDNAIVTYSLQSGSNDVFYIHNTDGTLYIQQGVYTEDGYQFTVTATDGTFETSTDLTVRTLASSNVAVLFINGGLLEDVDDIVEELSTSTGYWVQALTSAVISESDAANFTSLKSLSSWTKRATDTNTLLRLVLYGLNITEPVASEILVSTVEGTNFTWGISDLATLESILADSSESAMLTEFDTRGYWAAIIVLSVLLLLLAIAAGVVYFLFCRPNKSTSVESDVSYENFDGRQSNESNGNYYVKSVTLSESQDHVTSPNLTKRKSVAFSSTVEEIEVARL